MVGGGCGVGGGLGILRVCVVCRLAMSPIPPLVRPIAPAILSAERVKFQTLRESVV